jgi:putative DNA primase/helicase
MNIPASHPIIAAEIERRRKAAGPQRPVSVEAKTGELISVNAANIPMRAIEWLWPDRLAYGKLGLLGGLPDMGKGLITAFMMACITTQQEYPCGEGAPPRSGRVLYLSAEDDIEDTIIPRLKAAGADLSRIEIIKCVRKEGKDKSFSLVTDLDELQAKIDTHGDVEAIFIDPVASYTGGGKVNNHMNSEVRSFLTPLTDMAAEKHIFVLGVVHFNKKADVTSAMLRISDSLAYVAAARHVYVVVNDPEVEGQRLFVKAKNNLSTDNKALSYFTQAKKVGFDAKLQKEIWAPYVVWGTEHVKVTANEAMAAENTGGASQIAKRDAIEFLNKRLASGAVKSAELKEEAEANNISWATLRRAQKELGITANKPKGKFDGAWVWELPAKTGTWTDLLGG